MWKNKLVVISTLLIGFLFLIPFKSISQTTCEAFATGDWDNAAIWRDADNPGNPCPCNDGYPGALNNSGGQTDCPDAVVILETFDVTIRGGDDIYYNGTLQVFGGLIFRRGVGGGDVASSVIMDASSMIQIASTGSLSAVNFGGIPAGNASDNFVTIGANTIDGSEINNLDIPNQLTEDTLGDPGGPGCAETGTCDADPLPVELLFFDAINSNNKVHLDWATATEENFEYFSIQRSKDIISWEEIGRVKGGGDSQVRLDYSFRDNNPISATSYYRLQSVDFDGYTEIFRAVSVFVESSTDLTIYPTVLTGSMININYQAIVERELTLRVLDLSGRIKYEALLNGTSVEIPTGIENGIYFIEISDQNIINRSRVIVSR